MNMWDSIWTAAKGLAGSKKFQAAVLAGIVWAIGKVGLHATAEELAPFVGPLWLYIFGQGLADFGKSAAEATAKPPTVPPA
jgi:hypothetical protein